MTTAGIQRSGGSTSLADVLDIVLDKGIVIDAFVRVSVIGIELLTIEARIVIASVDTYIRYAEAMQRLGQLPRTRDSGARGIPQGLGGAIPAVGNPLAGHVTAPQPAEAGHQPGPAAFSRPAPPAQSGSESESGRHG